MNGLPIEAGDDYRGKERRTLPFLVCLLERCCGGGHRLCVSLRPAFPLGPHSGDQGYPVLKVVFSGFTSCGPGLAGSSGVPRALSSGTVAFAKG